MVCGIRSSRGVGVWSAMRSKVLTAETSEDRRRRPELNPTPSVRVVEPYTFPRERVFLDGDEAISGRGSVR